MDKVTSTKECHCGHTAHKYRSRTFTNQLNFKVTRVFYRCEYCWSRINEDFIPEIDTMKTFDVVEWRKNNF